MIRALPKAFFVLLAAAFVLVSNSSQACSVCLGDPNSAQTKSANAAIIVMLIITGFVLSCFGVFFYQLFKRLSKNP